LPNALRSSGEEGHQAVEAVDSPGGAFGGRDPEAGVGMDGDDNGRRPVAGGDLEALAQPPAVGSVAGQVIGLGRPTLLGAARRARLVGVRIGEVVVVAAR